MWQYAGQHIERLLKVQQEKELCDKSCFKSEFLSQTEMLGNFYIHGNVIVFKGETCD